MTTGTDPRLEGLYADFAAADLQPLWTQHGLLPRTPPIADVPYVWRWEALRALAERAGELITIDRGGDRRVLALSNPGLGGEPYATRTLWAAVQYLGPGELAPAHRHSPAAIRFVLEGEAVCTFVDDEAIPMGPGDLVLTPAGRWHAHLSTGRAPMIWFDGLDLPMVRALDAVFAEPGDGAPPLAAAAAARVPGAGDAAGAGIVDDAGPEMPAWAMPAVPPGAPPLVYRWEDSDAALHTQLMGGRAHASVRFVDPRSGCDALATLRCTMSRVGATVRTPSLRRAGSSVLVVHRGSGWVVVGGRRWHVDRGDMIAVPSWAALDLEGESEMTVFAISDAPVLEALRLDRTETLSHHQDVETDDG